MTRKELFEWLETCPTHKWILVDEEHGYVRVSFHWREEEE